MCQGVRRHPDAATVHTQERSMLASTVLTPLWAPAPLIHPSPPLILPHTDNKAAAERWLTCLQAADLTVVLPAVPTTHLPPTTTPRHLIMLVRLPLPPPPPVPRPICPSNC
jgi:hypothetical protein